MKLPNFFGKKNVADEVARQPPFRLLTEFVPYKLYSDRRSSTTLGLSLKNLTGEPLMSSIVIELPKQLSFDQMGLNHEKELRLGDLAASEEKNARVEIFGGTSVEKGEYTINISAFAHYRDYGHVLNAIKKKSSIEVV
ncbi:MAG: hypothetical protein KGH61_00450 [Candidatus Micrarchaeota archaeon]|nr:hypothetical protein [Candidatus Micrarchaeota archaeon]MDE1847407.1 hypothetical protein [Candidatus Micrarchaeota archaeon]MDE1864098.1 hypothetical protein [Candidatus Micrarchaeota archaeon]